MPRSSPSKTRPDSPTPISSHKADVIEYWLGRMLEEFPLKGKMTLDELRDWHRDLLPFSEGAIAFAFETHRRNGGSFPHYGQIIDLCISYDPSSKSTVHCDSVCKSRHGKGYNENDMKWLFKRMQQLYAVGDTPDTEALLTELDSRRADGPPEWRK